MIEKITKETTSEELLNLISEMCEKKISEIEKNVEFYSTLDNVKISESVRIRREEVLNSFAIQKTIYIRLLGDICYFQALKRNES